MENKFKIDSFVLYVKYLNYGEKKLCSIYLLKYMYIMNMLFIKYVIYKKM